MLLSSLSLSNFRSYTKQVFSFHPFVTVILGPNASGKTNILEAITLSATGKSFRAESDKEMITWDTDIARVKAKTDADEAELVLTRGIVGGQKAPVKKYLVNGVPRRAIDFVGNVRAVVFRPEDLELVTDSPSIRRKYLDSVLVQVDREYRRNLASYERGLRQRNSLLDRIRDGEASRSQLLFWDHLLIQAGGYLTDARARFVEFVNSYKQPQTEVSMQALSTLYQLEYDKSVISQMRLMEYKDEEIQAGATLVGPHRDDIIFTIQQKPGHTRLKQKNIVNNENTVLPGARNLNTYGSRGEQRLGVLWLKLAELSFIFTRAEDRPILLLDDIFSELDTKHRQLVLSLIKNQQTILTTAEEESIALISESGVPYEIIRVSAS